MPAIVLFTISIFLSAFLLFLVQPMVAKMFLPILGGSPAVWNTCMLFFQTVLLAGYGYVHLIANQVSVRRQVFTHLTAVSLPLLMLPINVTVQSSLVSPDEPILWLLSGLAVSVGVPFFVLSTTAPLLQKWFAATRHASASDPYFLYAASNAGSMVALLSYPGLIEPLIPLRPTEWLSQSWIWAFGYLLLAVLLGYTGLSLPSQQSDQPEESERRYGNVPLTPSTQVESPFRWILLSFAPSSLMLGATSYISLNIAAIPLFWIVPLVLYLLSFIIVFSHWPDRLHRFMMRATAPLLLLLILTLLPSGFRLPFWVTIILHLVVFFAFAIVCHGELARSRPPAKTLTLFYLSMSIGGALGGFFNAIIAPLLFQSLAEYQVALVIAACLMPPYSSWPSPRVESMRMSLPRIEAFMAELPRLALIACTLVGLLWLATGKRQDWPTLRPIVGSILDLAEQVGAAIGVEKTDTASFLACLAALALCTLSVNRPLRFGLGLGTLLLAASYAAVLTDRAVIHQERTFFGLLRVEYDSAANLHVLRHGSTIHGKQYLDAKNRSKPLTYYHQTGPIGQAMESFQGPFLKRRIAVVGLGTGTLASYLSAPQELTYYEIDPSVISIARDPKYFTHLQSAEERGVTLRTVTGDARLKLVDAPAGGYDLIVLDAFSSDAIPVHLLTKESIELYLQKLAPNGVIAIHISNRYLRLESVVGNLQRALTLAGRKQFDDEGGDKVPGKFGSDWVLLARQMKDLGPLAEDPRWSALADDPALGVWTDDFSNVLAVLDWSSSL